MPITLNTDRISICIPIFYKPELYTIIDRCLKSIKKYYPDFNLITLDDASLYFNPFSITIHNQKNLGFTASVNKLLKYAFKISDTVIIVNDDLEFKEGDLDRYRRLGNGIYSPRDTASGNLSTFGAIWGMNKKTYRKMGLLDNKYKHFCSDLDYYDKAIRLGVPIVKWTDICVLHHESATYKSENKTELLKRDQKIFNQKYK